jgi:hypothetical protein
MNPKHERFDFSKEDDQEKFSALQEDVQKEVINKQQGEANLIESNIGSSFSRMMVSADLYALTGNMEKTQNIFEQIARERKQKIEEYDTHVNTLITNIADYLASDRYNKGSTDVIPEFHFGDIKIIAAFLGREIIETPEQQILELGAYDGKTYFLLHNGQIVQEGNSMPGIYTLTDNNKHLA